MLLRKFDLKIVNPDLSWWSLFIQFLGIQWNIRSTEFQFTTLSFYFFSLQYDICEIVQCIEHWLCSFHTVKFIIFACFSSYFMHQLHIQLQQKWFLLLVRIFLLFALVNPFVFNVFCEYFEEKYFILRITRQIRQYIEK